MTCSAPSSAPRRRRAQANTGELTALEIADRIIADVPAGWWRHEGTYGSLMGSWLPPALRPVRRKLQLVVEVLLAGVLETLNPDWTAALDSDATGAPTSILLSVPRETIVLPVALSDKGIKIGIGAQVIGLRGRDAGRRILERLADLCAAELGTPARRPSLYN